MMWYLLEQAFSGPKDKESRIQSDIKKRIMNIFKLWLFLGRLYIRKTNSLKMQNSCFKDGDGGDPIGRRHTESSLLTSSPTIELLAMSCYKRNKIEHSSNNYQNPTEYRVLRVWLTSSKESDSFEILWFGSGSTFGRDPNKKHLQL